MPIDTSIYNNIQPIKLDSPVNAFAQMAQIQGVQNQNALAQYKLSQAQREDADAQEVRNVLANGDFTTAADRLMQKGYYKPAMELRKGQQEQEKLQSEVVKNKSAAGKSDAETAGVVMGAYRDQVNTIDTPQAAAQWATSMFNDPRLKGILTGTPEEAVARIPADPAGFAKWKLEASMNAEKLQTHLLERDKFGETQKHNRTTEGIQQGQLDVSQKTLGVAQANLGLRKEEVGLKRTEIGAGGKPPAGYRWGPDGQSLVSIPGGPADKAAVTTEGERKAATLLKRLEGSQKQLEAALVEKPDAATPGLFANGFRAIGAESLANTVATSSERQRVEAAQLDILDAALTLGTGAAYTKEQLEGYRKSYFPQVGDTDGTKADKATRLKTVIEAAKISAGRAAGTASSPTVPKAGMVQDGYRFKGGNAADPNAWEKV